jgi:hypothetical protein
VQIFNNKIENMKKDKFNNYCNAFVASGCSDYLDSENLYGKFGDFFKTPQISTRQCRVCTMHLRRRIFSEEQMAANLMDNMMLGGGGADDAGTTS